MHALRLAPILAVSLLAASCKEPPPPPPPAHSGVEDLMTATLQLSSEPPGASVFVDGADSGKQTPATLSLGAGKDYVVELRHPEFLPATEKVFAAPGKTVPLNVPLKAGARISVNSTPPGARIEVDGKDSFATPGKTGPLAPGKHLLVARAPGLGFEGKEFGITAAEELEWAPKLEAAVQVAVHSTPAGAAIEVDGKPVGLVTPADVSIPLGKHHVVRLTLEGYAALEHPLSELTAKTPPKPVELTLEPSTTASLKPRLAMADKKVRALEHKLKSLHARQSGFMVSNPKKELVLEHAIEETETKLEQAQAELDAIREELQKEQDKLPPK